MSTANIMRGYRWASRITVEGSSFAYFPSGVAITSHVRPTEFHPTALAILTTAGGGVTRINDNEIEVVMTPAQTAALPAGSVVIDFSRTDISPPQHLGFKLRISVEQPVTVPA